MPPPETPVVPTPPDVTGGPPAPAPEAPVEEPSLRRHLAATWRRLPVVVRWGGAAVLLALVAWAVTRGGEVIADAGPDEETVARRAAIARAEWAAVRRQAPTPIGRAPIADTLGPGDAERPDDRYADYYAYDADSLGFSVLVTAQDFAPDLAVRIPGGQTVAASDLLRTTRRAEIAGLEGPGRFEIVVTSVEPGAGGAYALEVIPNGPADSLFADAGVHLDTLRAGRQRGGRHERAFAVVAGVEAPVILRVVAEGFRPRLHLFGPNGEVRGEWRTVEASSPGAGLQSVVLRYLPGWEAPYRLLVTSEEPGATGPFAVDVRTVPLLDLRTDGQAVAGTLGDDSWLADGRYVDTYRFQVQRGFRTTVTARSDEVPPGLRLWKVGGSTRTRVAETLNRAGGGTASIEETLEAGVYHLEVLSGGEVEADEPTRGGAYTVAVRAEPTLPEPDSTWGGDAGPVPDSRVFSTEVRRVGRSGGSAFEVGVTNVALSYPGGTRTRVQLSVTVRSIDYTGNWAPWNSFAGKAYAVDDRGRRYAVSLAESVSPSGPEAEPGTARRGTVVLYGPGVARLKRIVFVASVGDETVTLPIPIP